MNINKRILYGLSALLILGYSLISPFNSASALDNKKADLPKFNEAKDLELKYGEGGKFWSGDLTHTWVNFFFNKNKDVDFDFRWDCSVYTREQAYASYKKSLDNKGGFLLTQGDYSFDSLYYGSKTQVKFLTLYWSENKSDEKILKYINYFGYVWDFSTRDSSGFHYLTAMYDDNGVVRFDCSDLRNSYFYVSAVLSASDERVSSDLRKKGYYNRTSTYLNTFPYKTDKNTIGQDILIRDAEKQEFYPHFEYDLNYLKLKLKHLKKEDHIEFPKAWDSYDNKKGYYIPDKTDYTVEFAVQKRKGGDVVQNGLQYIKADGSFTVDLPSLDEYSVSAKYMIKVCYAYSYDRDKTITPAENDYCFYAPPDDTPYLKYGMRTIYLNADGHSFSGSTLNMDCPYGFCSELPQKPKYEDCSQYDWNFNGLKIPSPGSIACSIRNSFVWFFTDFIFGILFPKIEDIQALCDDLLNTIIDRLGFLALPFTFIKGVFTTVQAMTTNNPTCAVPLTVFGSTANLEMCKWRYQLPAMWAFMQTILQGGIAIGFLWVCYRLANRFFGIYVEDYEEEDDDAYMTARWVDERTGETGDWQKFRRRD